MKCISSLYTLYVSSTQYTYIDIDIYNSKELGIW